MSETNNSEAKVQLLLSRSIVAGLPNEDQTLIAQTKAALRKIVDEAGEHVLTFEWADVARQTGVVYRDVLGAETPA